MSVRKILAGVLALAAIAGVVVGVRSLVQGHDAKQATRAAKNAAERVASRYLDLVAGASESDLPELWAMSATSSGWNGALRDAGRMLVASTERIEVVSVGEPQPIQGDREEVGRFSADDYWQVPAQIRLRGTTVSWPVEVGRLAGTSGSEPGDWRVLDVDYPALDWSPAAVLYGSDQYVSGVPQTRGNSDLAVGQPLYPAVYQVQQRIDPWAASKVAEVVVLDSSKTRVPKLAFEPTQPTADWAKQQMRRQLRACGAPDLSFPCPTSSIATELGLDVDASQDWWLGVPRFPRMQVRRNQMIMRDGAVRVRIGAEVRTVRFGGTAYFSVSPRGSAVGLDYGGSAPGWDALRWEVER